MKMRHLYVEFDRATCRKAGALPRTDINQTSLISAEAVVMVDFNTDGAAVVTIKGKTEDMKITGVKSMTLGHVFEGPI